MGRYATKEQAKAQGVPAAMADPDVEALLETAARYIDRATGFWFDKRAGLTMALDGNDKPVLPLPAPLLTATSVTVFNQVVLTGSYVIRNQRELEDFWDPRIEWIALALRLERAFGAAGPFGQKAGFQNVWPWGQKNVVITGDWGFVEEDNKPPLLITRACAILAANLSRTGGDRFENFLQSEKFGNYEYNFGNRGTGFLLTGDVEVDNIVATYSRVPEMVSV